MTVRSAKFTDVPRLFDLLKEGYENSRYAGTEVEIDEKVAKALLVTSIRRHGGTNAGSCLVLASVDSNDVPQGFILAVLAPIYEVSKRLYATDIFFYQGESSIVPDTRGLLRGVVDWAKPNKKVYELKFGITDAIGDWNRTQKLYRRMGFRQEGLMFGMRIER